jgi:hypothetical protein
MSQQAPHPIWRQLAVGVSLVTFLIAVYFLTYSGYAISGDEWSLFDATESLARRGTLEQNYHFDAYPPISLSAAHPPSADTEPLEPALAAPLFLIAQALPGIGLAHTVWLFNILITALLAGTLYAYGLALGYSVPVAALTALVSGLGTIVWPYSRTFFREPLFTWLALLSAYLMMRVRQRVAARERVLPSFIAFALACTGAVLSKEASFLLVPVILVEAVPSRVGRLRITRRGILVLIGLAVLAGVLAVIVLNADTLFGITGRYALTRRLQMARANVSGVWKGISGYMFSPARSVWVYSPVLLLGFFGWPRLAREHRWRQIAVPLVTLASFTVGYAAVRGAQTWYGGTGWGARYLVPVTPFLALWLLPVIDSLLKAGTTWWKRTGAALVFLVSAGVQILPALVPVDAYYDELGAQQPPVIPWNEGAWSLRWSPIRVSLELIGHQKIDVAWKYAAGGAWLLPALCIVLGTASLGWLGWWMLHQSSQRQLFARAAGSLAVLAVLTLGGGLYAIRQDPRYFGNFKPMRDLLDALEAQLRADDALVLNDYTYSEFFMNYFKRAKPVVYTLPLSPGERSSPEQAPEIESPDPDALIHLSDTVTLGALAEQHDRLWLVINSSPFVPWSVRPVEHYLSVHYFPVSEIKSTDIARAVLFNMTPAPPTTASAWPAQRADATFGENVRLVGWDIPGGLTRKPGDVLPVSLLWEALAPISDDYTVGVYLLSKDGQLVAQRDSFPVNYFEPTTTWRTDSLHRDNHGLLLPAALPPGEYELWVALYWWQPPDHTERLPVRGTNGQALGDHIVLATVIVKH